MFVGQPAEETGSGARALSTTASTLVSPNPISPSACMTTRRSRPARSASPKVIATRMSTPSTSRCAGVGGHGAYPHKTKDPVVLAAEMINAWQTIASRENNPVDPIVVTVGSIHGGTKHNIISDEVKMQLTVRSYKAGSARAGPGRDRSHRQGTSPPPPDSRRIACRSSRWTRINLPRRPTTTRS